MNMIEKVARAIHEGQFIVPWEQIKDVRMAQARAAIEAMREQPEATLRHAGVFLGLSPDDNVSMKAAWNFMLDAALNEK